MNAGSAQAMLVGLGQIASALIEVEAMKAENIGREQKGYALAHGPEDFYRVQQQMLERVREQASWVIA